MMLDLLGSNNWDRPVYFVTVGHGNGTNLKNYFQLDGFASRFVPIKTDLNKNRVGHINTDLLYDKYMNVFKYGNIQDTSIYIDETTARTIKILKIRENFGNLAIALSDENKNDSARAVLAKCKKILPQSQMEYSIYDFRLGEAYYYSGDTLGGDQFVTDFSNRLISELDYYFSNTGKFINSYSSEKQTNIAALKELIRITGVNKRKDLSAKLQESFVKYYTMLMKGGGV